MLAATPAPRLRLRLPASGGSSVRAVALVLPGGRENGYGRAYPWRLPQLRMVPFANDLYRVGRAAGLAVGLLCYRYQGWNAPAMDPVVDTRWALEEVRRHHPGVPVVLVGHSMGGRVALRVADDPSVHAVCALAPWTEPDDPVEQLAGTTVLIAHGDRDRITSPVRSLAYARRAREVTDRVSWIEIVGERHAMVLRPWRWQLLVRRFVLDALRGSA